MDNGGLSTTLLVYLFGILVIAFAFVLTIVIIVLSSGTAETAG